MPFVTAVTPERYFLGTRTAKRPDWTAYLMEPLATRTKKAESQVKEIEEKKAEQDANASNYPVSGTLVSAVVLDSSGQEVFTTFQDPSGTVGGASMRTLQFLEAVGACEFVPPAVKVDLVDCGCRLYGFHIAERLHLMFLDALFFGRLTKTPVAIASGLWYHRAFEAAPWMDPFHLLVPSNMRDKDLDRQGLCDFLGIPCPDDLDDDPAEQANVARLMAIKAQLFPVRADMVL